MQIIDYLSFGSQCCLSIVIRPVPRSANFQMYDLINFRRIIVILAFPFHFLSFSFFVHFIYKITSRYPNCRCYYYNASHYVVSEKLQDFIYAYFVDNLPETFHKFWPCFFAPTLKQKGIWNKLSLTLLQSLTQVQNPYLHGVPSGKIWSI